MTRHLLPKFSCITNFNRLMQSKQASKLKGQPLNQQSRSTKTIVKLIAV